MGTISIRFQSSDVRDASGGALPAKVYRVDVRQDDGKVERKLIATVRTAAQRDRRVREAGRGMRSLWARHVEVKALPVTDPRGDR